MILLETIQIAKPCRAEWDAMTGDAQVRRCSACRQNVYNLSEMTRAQAEAVILAHEGHLCVRLYTRADGTVLTRDCPVGLRAFWLKTGRRLSWATALAVSCLAGLWRGETAHAVTQAPPAASASYKKANAPHAATQRGKSWLEGIFSSSPTVTMGMPTAILPPPAKPLPRSGTKHTAERPAPSRKGPGAWQ